MRKWEFSLNEKWKFFLAKMRRLLSSETLDMTFYKCSKWVLDPSYRHNSHPQYLTISFKAGVKFELSTQWCWHYLAMSSKENNQMSLWCPSHHPPSSRTPIQSALQKTHQSHDSLQPISGQPSQSSNQSLLPTQPQHSMLQQNVLLFHHYGPSMKHSSMFNLKSMTNLLGTIKLAPLRDFHQRVSGFQRVEQIGSANRWS